ncbi:ABC transporter permease [Solicola gregarius]|uniref:Molybdenum transport system permease n=1 Tax=Solicola gregarius TaxID=2908642 RepID=A0AA46TKS9_9ACTN|nr:ABC transporter permease [Solicola gregarius]UYM06248.1 ABC transporter permease [Solicola gregarius]
MGSSRAPERDAAALGRAPAVLLVLSGLALVVLLLPVVSLLVRTPWTQLADRLTSPEILDALRLSLVSATTAAALSLLLGVPLAWLLARVDFRGRALVRALVTVPLVLPPVVGGIALLMAFGRRGVVGGPVYDAFGLTIPFTTTAVVLAQTFVALPFLVISVEGALRSADLRYDEVAATLGAGRWATFRTVTLPLAAPGVISGTVLAWARALGEFGATITFAGNFPGTTRTMPLEIYTARQADEGASLVLSAILLAISVLVLASLRERWIGGTPA